MNYKTVEIKGHQRAGNHYLAYLVNENFFNLPNFYAFFKNGSHKFGYQHTRFDDSTLYIYIHADLNTTAQSLLKIRGRFSIGTDNIEDLLSDKKMGEYASKDVKPNIALDKFTQEAFDKANDSKDRRSNFAFDFKNMSLKEWHTKHVNSWLSIERPNLIYVKYEDLINNFDNTMQSIANKLGSDRKTFINTDKQIGVIHEDEDIL